MEVIEKKMKMMLLQLHTTNPNNNIPKDVIIEILSWLPAKYLLRLRWVCKYWFDIITSNNRDDVDDSFFKMHLRRQIISPCYEVLSFCFLNLNGYPYGGKLCQGNYYFEDTNNHVSSSSSRSEVIRIDHPSVKEECIHAILGSSNGLILLRLTNSKVHHLCILNPCTKEYRLLRRPLSLTAGETYGFGYDETMDEYKVIRIFHHDLERSRDDVDLSQYSEVEVYTLGNDSWRWIGDCPYQLSSSAGVFPYCPYQLSSSAGVFMNGALYWMDIGLENIISFDIGKEEFQHVVKTPNLIGHPRLYELQVFEGSLCLVLLLCINDDDHNSQLVEIWVMENYTVNNNNNNDSLLWTKLLTIPGPQWFPIKPVRYTTNDEILILSNHKDLVLYDPKNTRDPETLRWILENRNPSSMLEFYTESLVPLNSGTYAQETKIEADQETRT